MTSREKRGPPQRSLRAPAMALLFLSASPPYGCSASTALRNLGRATLAIGGAGWLRGGPSGDRWLLRSLFRSVHAVGVDHRSADRQHATGTTAIALRAFWRCCTHAVCPIAATLRRLFRLRLAFMVYLGALTCLSILHSPDARQLRHDLRIGSQWPGAFAFLLLFGGRPGRQCPPGCASQERAGDGGGSGSPFRSSFWGRSYSPGGSIPLCGKIFGVSWEANLFASLLAALSFFAIERFSQSHDR